MNTPLLFDAGARQRRTAVIRFRPPVSDRPAGTGRVRRPPIAPRTWRSVAVFVVVALAVALLLARQPAARVVLGNTAEEQLLMVEKQALVAGSSPIRRSEGASDLASEKAELLRRGLDPDAAATAALVARGLVPRDAFDREAADTAALVARGLVP
ncbi:hypothetical protein [Salsipaludibacter albus]|uniref:hypothetical protein n=1 Tax=Salsipaludibacter albus TaxID=2849650 RepID=UPI001EE4DCF2|nr:hypothetical protein [Salsipaludibacter albus]MBY5163478.1 hypothetical protein [Salsipaludibacter albus]